MAFFIVWGDKIMGCGVLDLCHVRFSLHSLNYLQLFLREEMHIGGAQWG